MAGPLTVLIKTYVYIRYIRRSYINNKLPDAHQREVDTITGIIIEGARHLDDTTWYLRQMTLNIYKSYHLRQYERAALTSTIS